MMQDLNLALEKQQAVQDKVSRLREVLTRKSSFPENHFERGYVQDVDGQDIVSLEQVAKAITSSRKIVDSNVNSTNSVETFISSLFGIQSESSDEYRKAVKKLTLETAKTGGDAVAPKMITLSFPGAEKGYLHFILKEMMHLNSHAGGDFYAMNETKSTVISKRKELPNHWKSTLGGTKSWKEMIQLLKSIKVKGLYPFADGNSAPHWFVDEWGKAAFYCAQKSATQGTGVIILKNWPGYTLREYCHLEFLFSKSLARVFPNSVYVVIGNDKDHFLSSDESESFYKEDY